MNLADAVTRHAERDPDGIALVEPATPPEPRRATSWRELEAAVTRAAALLGDWGLRAPQRVLLHAENCLAVVVAHLACLRTGTVSTPINPQSTPTELLALVRSTGASLLLTDADPLPRSADLDRAVPTRRIGDVLTETPVTAAPLAAPLDPESLAVLIQTSGSVSEPRAVMLSQRALAAHCRHSEAGGRLRPEDVVLGLLPVFHVYGLNAVLGAALHAGARTVLTAGMRPDLVDVVRSEGVTELPVTPTVLFRLLQLPGVADGLAGVRRVTSGAAPLSTAIAREFTRVTGVSVEQAYGLTEAAPGVSATDLSGGSPAGGVLSGTHVGTPLPGVEVRIGTGLDEVEPGEIHVRGDNLFSGYWPDGSGGPGPDGWFATGDLGYRSERELFLVGRLREVVIVSGFNVYPGEVEEVLLRHPAVHAAAVIGHPDEQTGESLVAFVSVVPGRRGLSVGALQRHCQEHLARYKCPGEIYVLERMPRSITGKILKRELRQLVDALEEEQ